MPATFALHDTVALPEPVRLAGVIAPQTSPDGTVSDKLTVPLKWFNAVMVIVEMADWAALTGAGLVADVVKSWKRKRAVVEWFSDPLVPVRVRV